MFSEWLDMHKRRSRNTFILSMDGIHNHMLQLLESIWAYWWSNSVFKGILHYYSIMLLLFLQLFKASSLFKGSWWALLLDRFLTLLVFLVCIFCFFSWSINITIWSSISLMNFFNSSISIDIWWTRSLESDASVTITSI